MKSERVSQLELILRSHPEGLRKSDIARRMGVHRSTIGRYIEDLKQYSNVFEEDNLVKITAKDSEDPMTLSVYESLALNMGAEMLLSNSDSQNPHLASALRKIAVNMENSAPKIASSIKAIADESERRILKSNNRDNYSSVLEVLIDAWISGRMVKITHTNRNTNEETELAPYFIGFVEVEKGRKPITLTGRLRHTTEIITVDISKIKSVEILNETYTIPDNLKVFRKNENTSSFEDVIDTIPLELIVSQKSALNSFRNLVHGKITVRSLSNGKYKCNFDAENSIELILRIIQCFDSVEVVGPEKFRNKFVGILKQILSTYER